jgi:hypothetical protein
MRNILVLAFALGSIAATAQQPAATAPVAVKGWDAVRALPSGATLDIKLRKGSANCVFGSADADTLTCQRGTSITVQRVDIRSIKIHHRGRSTLSGLAIGAGVGALVGAASSPPCNNFCIVGGRGFGAVVLGVPGAAIGALTGYLSDFTRSVVYRSK